MKRRAVASYALGLLLLTLALFAVEVLALFYQPDWKWAIALMLSASVYVMPFIGVRWRRAAVLMLSLTVAGTISYPYIQGAFLSEEVGWLALSYGVLFAVLTLLGLLGASGLVGRLAVLLKHE